ncbi:MAG: ATP synthase F1 subunit delta [Calditrichaceae bacterium]|nr:ATP synthase F1 subunit delta [Calditrichaceae bacterium]MBN2707523.1 ATP synthase F1 subunit delta [Calditrichaceae bacterium]
MSRVAKRYAKAIFQLAVEQKQLPAYKEDFERIKNLIHESGDFRSFLLNPLLNDHQRADIIKKIFEGKVSESVLNFLLLTAEKRRLSLIETMVDYFNKMYLDYNNQIEGELISAVEILPKQFDKIKASVESAVGKQVIFTKRLEPAIIGGFVVKVGDSVIDNSIRYQLNKLREKLKTQ